MMKTRLIQKMLVTGCAALALALTGTVYAKGGGGGGGMGGMSGSHMSGGTSSSHMSGSGMTNTNGPSAADRDLGKDRASDRHVIDANRKATKDVADKAKGKGKGLTK